MLQPRARRWPRRRRVLSRAGSSCDRLLRAGRTAWNLIPAYSGSQAVAVAAVAGPQRAVFQPAVTEPAVAHETAVESAVDGVLRILAVIHHRGVLNDRSP